LPTTATSQEARQAKGSQQIWTSAAQVAADMGGLLGAGAPEAAAPPPPLPSLGVQRRGPGDLLDLEDDPRPGTSAGRRGVQLPSPSCAAAASPPHRRAAAAYKRRRVAASGTPTSLHSPKQ
jgi:hypothetical protein